MGWVASFIPTPVMRGFIEGLVYLTIIGQVPHLLGISGGLGNFFEKLWHILQHLPDVRVAPALTGIVCLAAMLLLPTGASRTGSAGRHGRSNHCDRLARRGGDRRARRRAHTLGPASFHGT